MKNNFKLSLKRGLAESETIVRFKRYCKDKEKIKAFEKDVKYFSYEQMTMVCLARNLEEMILWINADLDFWSNEYGLSHPDYEIGNASESFQFLIFMEAMEEVDVEMDENKKVEEKQVVSERKGKDNGGFIQRLRNSFWRAWYRIPGTSHFEKS